MIKVENITKSYALGNKEKSQILKGISLSFDEKGFVSILGKSGSGKTTLLNIIGGLDQGNGTIFYDENKLNRYDSKVIDLYRNKNIGYVFQNYLLLPDLTVYENIDIALTLAGVNNKEERKRRIETCLKVVGLERYKRRISTALSGGQQQRVAIARALAKDSKVLICDEPTGNLDSVNAKEIMKILKGISKHKLVLMVTHNESLAYQYSDRIIRIKDGLITSDKQNDGVITQDDNFIINVNEMKKSTYQVGNISINHYSDDDSENIELSLITHQGKIKIVVDSSQGIIDERYQIIDQVKEDHEDIEVIFNQDFDNKKEKGNFFKKIFNSIKRNVNVKKGKKSLYIGFTLFGILISCFFYIISISEQLYGSQINQNHIYFNNQMVAVPSLEADVVAQKVDKETIYSWLDNEESGITTLRSSYADATIVNYIYNDFEVIHKSPASLTTNRTSIIEYKHYQNALPEPYIGKIAKNNEVMITSSFLEYYLTPYRVNNKFIEDEEILGSEFYFSLGSTPYQIVGVIKSDVSAIICPSESYLNFIDDFEMISGKRYYASIIDDSTTLTKDNYLIDKSLMLLEVLNQKNEEKPNAYISNSLYEIYENSIVDLGNRINLLGVIDEQEKLIVFDEEKDYELFKDSIYKQLVAKNFRFPHAYFSYHDIDSLDNSLITYLDENHKSSKGDIIVSKSMYQLLLKYEVEQLALGEIDGYYDDSDISIARIYSSREGYELFLLESNEISFVNYLNYFIVDDVLEAEESLKLLGWELISANDYFASDVVEEVKQLFTIVIIVILGVTAVFVYLMNRSKMIKNIYTIGVFRSLGVMKKNIYKTFFYDSISVTTFTMGLGYIVASIFIYFLSLMFNVPLFNVGYFLFGLLIIYLINIVSSLLPLFILLRKTPREITIKYDI